MINGPTQLVAIAGSPIAQVKSPANFNAWFQAQSLDIAMIPIDIHEGRLPAFVDTLRGWQNLRGCVITVPYKQVIAGMLDSLSDRARVLRSVNVIHRGADGHLRGDNVDGAGFINAAHQQGFEPADQRALVVGSGGVGSAIAYSLCEAGVRALTLLDVSAQRSAALVDVLKGHFPNVTFSLAADALSDFDLVANASPVGMGDSGELPLPKALLDTLPAACHVADVVTSPEITPLLALARERGCTVQTGQQMARAQMGDLGHFMGVTPLAI